MPRGCRKALVTITLTQKWLVFFGGDGNRRRRNIPRIFRDRMNPFDVMTDHELLKKYRLDRITILEICVLVALRYYATGSFQSVLADGHGVSIHSVSRSIHAVSESLIRQVPQQIKFPTSRTEINTKQRFYEIGGFPNVIGAVDGTYIPLKSPTDDEHLYVTRKGYHAINVQAVFAVLHNMCISRNLPLIDDKINHEDDDNDSDVNGDDNNENYRENNNNDDGRQVRDNLIREMFSHAS
ncbi:putative nuclease HARBI1 [Ruditapes philippinarum]|uniref:putative nuclease HARBI1 n=1 Tax=Ruditapes philippinarum TaxID=129788 RepID=UPI00295B983E|nr:putative nuclease HARBI1 [Ruditapes philippinarum]